MTRLRGLIFDFDGTIADTLPICVEAFQTSAHRHGGRRPDLDEVRALFGATEEGMFERLLGDGAAAAVDTYLEEYERLHARCAEPFAGLGEVFAAVRDAGVRLAIVTGKGARSLQISVRVLGIDALFPDRESGSPAGCVKAERIRAVLGRWDCPREQVAHVGDSPYDVRAAREAGVQAVGAAWAPGTDVSALEAAGPDRVFDDVARFREWVGRCVAAR